MPSGSVKNEDNDKEVGTETGGLDGDTWRMVSCEERCVDINSINQTRYAKLNDAPVVTFRNKTKNKILVIWRMLINSNNYLSDLTTISSLPQIQPGADLENLVP